MPSVFCLQGTREHPRHSCHLSQQMPSGARTVPSGCLKSSVSCLPLWALGGGRLAETQAAFLPMVLAFATHHEHVSA